MSSVRLCVCVCVASVNQQKQWNALNLLSIWNESEQFLCESTSFYDCVMSTTYRSQRPQHNIFPKWNSVVRSVLYSIIVSILHFSTVYRLHLQFDRCCIFSVLNRKANEQREKILNYILFVAFAICGLFYFCSFSFYLTEVQQFSLPDLILFSNSREKKKIVRSDNGMSKCVQQCGALQNCVDSTRCDRCVVFSWIVSYRSIEFEQLRLDRDYCIQQWATKSKKKRKK